MKRKVLAMVLTAAMAVGMMTGCGESSGESKDTGDKSDISKSASLESSKSKSDENEDEDVNEDGTVNNPEAVKVDKNKLVFWSLFSGGDGGFMDKIISDYNGTKPTKEVQSIMLVWGDYYTKLQTAVAAKKGPDIGVSHASKLPELVDQGVVEPIDSYLKDLNVDLSSMYSQNSLDSVTFDGEIYAIPLDTHAEILYFNKDILEKSGISLNADGQLDINSEQEFKDILEKCKAVMGDGESTIALTNNGDDPYRIWWASYFQMGGKPLVNEDGSKVTLDKDIAVKAAEFVKSLYDDGYVAEGIDDHQKFFQSGKAAFLFGGTWATGALEQTENLNFAAQPWPMLFESDDCWADSHTLILPVNQNRSKEDTKAAVEFMVGASKDGGLTWAGSGQIPANKNVLDSQEYKDMPYRSSYMSELDKAVLPSKTPHFYSMKSGMIDSLNTLWSGQTDAKSAIDALYDQLNSSLE